MQDTVSNIYPILSSALGDFHQNILGCIDQWTNHDAGYDLESIPRKMLAEIKNKHNTMNATGKAAVIRDLDTAVRQKESGWTGYLVIIIPKKPVRYETKLTTQRPVYEIDGASFYTKVTGEQRALHDLFSVLVKTLERKKSCNIPEDIKTYCHSMVNQNIPD